MVSPSIENWKGKILKRYKGVEYDELIHKQGAATFFGLYRDTDYERFFRHEGTKTVVWCGSDILQTGLVFRDIQKVKARHICENEIEAGILKLMLQTNDIEVKQLFFSDVGDFLMSYEQKERPEVFMHINKNAEPESGYYTIESVAPRVPEVTFHIYGNMEKRETPKNIVLHGYVPEEQFNKEIKGYQASLRLHEYDGFAETTAKSVLLGQWPISKIRFPFVDSYTDEEELVSLLGSLKRKTSPNIFARQYYLKEFKKTL